MPSSTQRQHNLMEMVAHDPKAAKRVGVPQKVGKEFAAADKGKSFGKKRKPTDSERQAMATALRAKKPKEPPEGELNGDY